MADLGYEQGAGSPEQLPQGAATEANEGTEVVAPDPIDVETGVTDEAVPVEEPEASEEDVLGPEDLAEAGDYDPEGYTPIDEDEEFLVSPTLRPWESQAAGSQYPAPLSQRTRANLPELQKAASQPGASPAIIALVNLLLRSTE